MMRMIPKVALAVVLTLAAVATSRAAPPTEADKKFVKEVADKLLAVCPPPPAEFNWPPDIGIQDSPAINAFAGLFSKDKQLVKKDGKYIVGIRITTGMLNKVIAGDEDRLAFVLGHELSHVLRKHLPPKNRKVPFLQATFDRGEEDEADQMGVELMLKAGYSLERAMKAITKMQELGLEYSSFEGLGVGHPSWNDRAAKIDKEKSHLWKAMSAFNNGVVFLATEQFEAAEVCFERVTDEFPACHEAWANLGFARLMQYCDKMDPTKLRVRGIGHVVTGGFYEHTPITVRGEDEKLWLAAVDALQTANTLKKTQPLVLSNLGLAYLVKPKAKDVREATRYLSQAAEAAKTDKALHPLAHAGLLVNFGVATLASGDAKKGLDQLAEAEATVRMFAGGPPGGRLTPAFDAALTYTRALALAEKKDKPDQEKARVLFEKYLENTSPLSLWWTPAYEHYQELCKALGKEPKTRGAFATSRPEPTRLVASVALRSGARITLTDEIENVIKLLGTGKETIAVSGTSLRRIAYEKEGIELIANDRDVLAITLVGPDAPAVPLRGKMVGGSPAGVLKVGMTEKELVQLLGSRPHPCEIVTPEKFFDYYRELGVAVRMENGKVAELVIVQLPEPKKK